MCCLQVEPPLLLLPPWVDDVCAFRCYRHPGWLACISLIAVLPIVSLGGGGWGLLRQLFTFVAPMHTLQCPYHCCLVCHVVC